MYCYTQCPQPCSRPPWTHGSAGDSWKFPGKSGSVSCGGHCSFPLGPGEHRVFLCPLRVYFPVLCMFWQLYGGVNGDLLQEGLCHIQVCCTQSPCPCGSPLLTHSSIGDAQTQFVSASVTSLGPGVHKACLSAWASLAGMGFDSKHEFAPPTVLLGFLLCPWTWDISSKKFQCGTATAPAPTVFLWLLWPCWGAQ